MKYAVIIEAGEHNYSAYVPDLLGCVSTGKTLEDVEQNIREAMAFHLEGMKLEGLPIPEPITRCTYVEAPDR
jgi:predicted RNase H-like HicB family nuclease